MNAISTYESTNAASNNTERSPLTVALDTLVEIATNSTDTDLRLAAAQAILEYWKL